mgnify:CR=1 FL=1
MRRSSRRAQSKFPFTEAMTHFARALGAAGAAIPPRAQKDVERIAALRDELKAAKNEYWANEVEVMRPRVARLGRRSRRRRATRRSALMRQAADIEDKSEKNIVTPGRLLPARELLGDMLLELKRPAEALEGIRGLAAARSRIAIVACTVRGRRRRSPATATRRGTTSQAD